MLEGYISSSRLLKTRLLKTLCAPFRSGLLSTFRGPAALVIPRAEPDNSSGPSNNRMPLLVIGINHRTAPVEIREKVVFAGEELPDALRDLTGISGVREALIVSTCNRTELYCVAEENEAQIVPWLANWHELAPHHLERGGALYRLQGSEAIKHLFAVACGLDSMVL